MSLETCKKMAGEKGASFVEDGMIVGLGTGSTAYYFIEKLTKRVQDGLKIEAVASSQSSSDQARKGNIPLIDINTLKSIDIYVDGADEIDPQKRMIKGGGGALLREKIVAHMSREMIVIVDESKLVSQLGKKPLPVEIVPFGHAATVHQIELLGFKGKLRTHNNSLYITENGNFLYDIHLNPSQSNPSMIIHQITAIPGVVETGFFIDLAGRVVIGFQDGKVVVQ